MINETNEQILVYINRLITIYRQLSMHSSTSNIIAVADAKIKSLATPDVKQKFSNLDDISFLNFGDSLLTDYHTIVKRAIDDCKEINDKICNTYEFFNKLDNEWFEIQKLLQDKKYIEVYNKMLQNAEYLKNELQDVDKFDEF